MEKFKKPNVLFDSFNTEYSKVCLKYYYSLCESKEDVNRFVLTLKDVQEKAKSETLKNECLSLGLFISRQIN